jgi:alanine racemase
MLLLFPVEMRLKVKTGINNSLIDDSYSSDFQSLKIALISESQKQSRKDGYSSIYFKAACPMRNYIPKFQLIISNNISRVIGIGETISEFKDKFVNCITFNNTNLSLILIKSFANETILIRSGLSV